MTISPGKRVRWANPCDGEAEAERGVVLAATAEDWAEHQRQGYPENRNVLVLWEFDGDDPEMAAWFDPTELAQSE